MPLGRINNIQDPRPGKPDHLAWIRPDGSQGKDNDLRYYFDARREPLERGMRVSYDAARPGWARNVRPSAGAAEPPAPAAPAQQHNDSPQGDPMALCVPRMTHAPASAAVRTKVQDLNPGLLLDRFPEEDHVKSQENQKTHLDRVVRAAPWKGDYAAIVDRLAPTGTYWLLTAKSRITLHLSRAGGLENANCCLHPVYGFAYLPGSGLKGLAHAYACHVFQAKNEGSGALGKWESDKQRDEFIGEVEDIFGWAPNNERRGMAHGKSDEDKEKHAQWLPRWNRETSRKNEHSETITAQRGAVVFHDAFADKPPQLEIDVLTCHYPKYYMGDEAPGDWQSPRPVTFLTIAAGTRFRFRISDAFPRYDAAGRPVETPQVTAAKRLLLGGLHWLGTGAKTAAGYGWFEENWELTPEQQIEATAKRQAEEQAATAEAEAEKAGRLEDTYRRISEENRILLTTKETNNAGRKFYRLIRNAAGKWDWEEEWEAKRGTGPFAPGRYSAKPHETVDKRPTDIQALEDLDEPPGRPG